MPPPVYTVCFIKGNTGGGPLLYTVAAGMVAIAACLDVYAGASTPGAVARFIDNDTGQSIWYDIAATDSSTYMSWRGRQTFTAGETMAVASENHTIDARLTGYLFSA